VRRKNSAVAIVKTFQHSNATSPIWPGTTFTSSCAHGYPRTHVVPIGGLPFVLWGIFFRTVAGLHTTWLVNSVSHIWGSRRFETRNTSTNNWWVALLSFGDGWHNNHHANPVSARHGLKWYEIDVNWYTIWIFKQLGLASHIHQAQLPARVYANQS
jgi:fatty-acid desaturase